MIIRNTSIGMPRITSMYIFAVCFNHLRRLIRIQQIPAPNNDPNRIDSTAIFTVSHRPPVM